MRVYPRDSGFEIPNLLENRRIELKHCSKRVELNQF
jgi:hypothetical protein